MSGKFESKKKKSAPKSKKKNFLWIAAAAALVVLLAAGVILLRGGEEKPGAEGPQAETAAEKTSAAKIEAIHAANLNLDMQLEITDIGSYAGIYMEDGTDEFVSGVLMLVVKNITEDPVLYAEIDMTVGEETAHFSLSTLPAGESVVLLEQNRMAYSKDVTYEACPVKASNVAISPDPLQLQEDKLKIQGLEGVLNVTNLSDEDIQENVVIYYKNSAADLYYGGITYRVTLEGGLKAGEIRQTTAGHYRPGASTLMFAQLIP